MFNLIFFYQLFSQSLATTINWYFGNQAGLTWDTLQANGDPMYLMDGAMSTEEGVLTISDNDGKLLFYSDGVHVWNKNHEIMQNTLASSPGGTLMGHSSSTQSCIAVPKPVDPNAYYIFTADDRLGSNGATYSRLDMTANGGLGDIDLAEKNVPMFSPATEKIAAASNSNGSDYWVIFHKWDSDTFLVYALTSSGVQLATPVISVAGSAHTGLSPFDDKSGYMKTSISGSLLALTKLESGTCELFHFNYAVGIVSHITTISHTSLENPYGLEFSADDKFLYVSEFLGNEIHQWDISSLDSVTINASHQIIATTAPGVGGALQMGPDLKIYHARNQTNYLGRIEFPSYGGTACNYVDEAVLLGPALQSAKISMSGLPNFKPTYYMNMALFNYQCDCSHDTNFFSVTSPLFFDTAYWNFNWPTSDTSFHRQSCESEMYFVFDSTGIYKVELIISSGGLLDTFSLNVIAARTPEFDFGVDTIFMTSGNPIVLDPNVVGNNYSYDWSTGSVNPTITVIYPATYCVTVSDEGCWAFDCVVVEEQIGIDEISENEIFLYPNPAKEKLLIAIEGTGTKTGSIYNSAGQLVESFGAFINNIEIDISAYNKGVYFVKIESSENTQINKRFIVVE